MEEPACTTYPRPIGKFKQQGRDAVPVVERGKREACRLPKTSALAARTIRGDTGLCRSLWIEGRGRAHVLFVPFIVLCSTVLSADGRKSGGMSTSLERQEAGSSERHLQIFPGNEEWSQDAADQGQMGEAGEKSAKLGLVTWNVNGLLPCLKRMGARDLTELLESFGHDVQIVCVQETKMQRSQLDQALARPRGWDAFYSFCSAKHAPNAGYSGTATFVRQCSRPIDAREGFSSLCCVAEMPSLLHRLGLYGAGTARGTSGKKRSAQEMDDDCSTGLNDSETEPASVDGVESGQIGLFDLLCSTTLDHLKLLDSEGRCVVTDHGDFVLINCYFPAMRSTDKFEFKLDEERYLFKLRFNLFLHQAIESLRKQGRRVVVVGDINISLCREDSACLDWDDDSAKSPARVWLRSLLQDQSLVDVFRVFHPQKKHIYTCWNQQTGARLTNFGSRIDYVLADHRLMRGECCVSGCEIEGHEGPHQKGSDHSPVLAWLSLDGSRRLPTNSWWAAAHKRAKGSEAMYFSTAQVCGMGGGGHSCGEQEREPPPMCATYLPEARKKQTSITSMFSASAPKPHLPVSEDASASISAAPQAIHASAPPPPLLRGAGGQHAVLGLQRPGEQRASRAGAASARTGKTTKQGLSEAATAARKRRGEDSPAQSSPSEWAELSYQGAKAAPAAPAAPCNSLMSFFVRHSAPKPADAVEAASHYVAAVADEPAPNDVLHALPTHEGEAATRGADGCAAPRGHAETRGEVPPLAAAEQWGKILCMNKTSKARPGATAPSYLSHKEQKAFLALANSAPLCPGHGEPSIQRVVQKPGPNQGRRFWVCARPNGAPGHAAARCDFFKWC